MKEGLNVVQNLFKGCKVVLNLFYICVWCKRVLNLLQTIMKAESKITLYRTSNNVVIYYSHNKKIFRLETGISVSNKKDFNKSNQMLSGKLASHNEYVWSLKKQIDNLIQDAIKQHSSDIVEYIKSQVIKTKEAFDGEVKIKTTKLSEQYEHFFNETYKDNEEFTIQTIKHWYTIKFDLERFEISSNYSNIGSIDSNFISNISKWYKDNGLKPRTIKKKQIMLKRFLNHNHDKISSDILISNKKVKVDIILPDVVIYSNEELKWIKTYQPKTKGEERLIDITIFSIYTACSFEDMCDINKAKIKDGVLYYSRNKTGSDCQVPLSNEAFDILKKYDYNMKIMSNQKYNEQWKELLSKQELFRIPYGFKSTLNGKDTSEPKWKLLSHKRCRSTFISLMIEQNVELNNIIKIVGHQDLKMIRYYMSRRLSNTDNLNMKLNNLF